MEYQMMVAWRHDHVGHLRAECLTVRGEKKYKTIETSLAQINHQKLVPYSQTTTY